ncbi:dihydroorotate dehydrogenase electron transfer subunit [Oceanirhabdus sp. W0125-5]|uniref:dihydroorotate dehydrogenase electron transfer subunit n=1 Tax=Oceanirhabdus sp. W0125-5 TaxID=2999116 RepID=UPI0022F2ABDC|nr:dihydroorotate dehydrogenase electron transfer subunit [Oceanirhabdus sp. W0125-5]WBW98908.1 dihydroorotate dehydrogenase electron transfer subunit [Oceanirhabdus sp. W0125-5]
MNNYKNALIKENRNVVDDIYLMKLQGDFKGKSGQFYMIKPQKNYTMLPRPISIHSVEEDGISFLYMAKGKGTKELSKISEGDTIEMFGPLGNGFDIDEIEKIEGKIAVVTGGIGVAPITQLINELKEKKIDLFCGFKSVDYSVENVEKNVNSIKISTETGVKGVKGYITDHLPVENYDLVITCGPEIMMKKVISECRKNKVKSLVLMENYMACGVGACLACVCETKWGIKRVCQEGPVFSGEELIWHE